MHPQDKLVRLELLERDDVLREYVDRLLAAVRVLRAFASKHDWYPLTGSVMWWYLDKFAATVWSLLLRHYANQSEYLSLDVYESGLPHSYALAVLESDLENPSPNRRVLLGKREVLGAVLETGVFDRSLARHLFESAYQHTLQRDALLLPFTFGGLGRYESHGGRATYRLHWATYDVALSAPRVYGLVFEYASANDTLTQADVRALVRLVKVDSGFNPSLHALARAIDDGCPTVHPKYLSCTTFGPVYWPGLESIRNPLQDALDANGEPGAFVTSVSHSYLVSRGERTTGAGARRLGIDRTLQEFIVSSVDPVAYLRGATEHKQWYLAPHLVLQSADPGVVAQHTCIPFDHNGEI